MPKVSYNDEAQLIFIFNQDHGNLLANKIFPCNDYDKHHIGETQYNLEKNESTKSNDQLNYITSEMPFYPTCKISNIFSIFPKTL